MNASFDLLHSLWLLLQNINRIGLFVPLVAFLIVTTPKDVFCFWWLSREDAELAVFFSFGNGCKSSLTQVAYNGICLVS